MIFFEKYDGQIISTLGASMVAILAAFLTYFLSKWQMNNKAKKYYQGLNKTLLCELKLQENQLHILQNSLSDLKKASIIKKEFVVNNIPLKFHTLYIETILINIVKYDNFDMHLVANIQALLFNLRDINFVLDFHTANELLLKLDKKGLETYIVNYYDRIDQENINKTKLCISQIIKLLNSKSNAL